MTAVRVFRRIGSFFETGCTPGFSRAMHGDSLLPHLKNIVQTIDWRAVDWSSPSARPNILEELTGWDSGSSAAIPALCPVWLQVGRGG